MSLHRTYRISGIFFKRNSKRVCGFNFSLYHLPQQNTNYTLSCPSGNSMVMIRRRQEHERVHRDIYNIYAFVCCVFHSFFCSFRFINHLVIISYCCTTVSRGKSRGTIRMLLSEWQVEQSQYDPEACPRRLKSNRDRSGGGIVYFPWASMDAEFDVMYVNHYPWLNISPR